MEEEGNRWVVKVLITGITGFVGSWLADYILETQPYVDICGIRRYRSPLDNISHILDKVKLYDCDLTDLSSVISILQKVEPAKIFHLAAQSYVPFSYVAPIKTMNDNINGTVNLLEAVKILGQSPLIHICSSSEVYGQVKEEDVPIKETQPFNPASPYAVSKVAEDMLGLQYFTSYGLKTVRTRMFTHTGPRRNEVFVCSNFAKQIALIEKGKQGHFINVGNIHSIRTFADVRDAVKAYWMLHDGMVGEAYNIGGNETMTVGEMLGMLLEIAQLEEPSTLIYDQDRFRPADVTLQIPDCSKFCEATGWQPEIPFEQTLTDLLNYWRERV